MIQSNNGINGYNPLQSANNPYESYNRLMEMRSTPYNQYRTVFNDIADE